jgi:hypothetical protein
VARRGFPHAIDADMTGFDQGCGAGAGFDNPRMPQPFVEALAIQAYEASCLRKISAQTPSAFVARENRYRIMR